LVEFWRNGAGGCPFFGFAYEGVVDPLAEVGAEVPVGVFVVGGWAAGVPWRVSYGLNLYFYGWERGSYQLGSAQGRWLPKGSVGAILTMMVGKVRSAKVFGTTIEPYPQI
jgi:hypothetical protein